MYDFPIGVILESFKTNRAAAIEKAAKMGANGIQMYATEGENSPENLSKSDRAELKREIENQYGFFSALRRPRKGIRK